MKGLSRPALWAVLLGVVACGEDPVVADTRVEFTPHESYTDLWFDLMDCSGESGDFQGIRWFVTPGFSSPGILGQWSSTREITLRIDVWTDPEVVQHEMLHDLLGGDGEHRHPSWSACDLPIGVDG